MRTDHQPSSRDITCSHPYHGGIPAGLRFGALAGRGCLVQQLSTDRTCDGCGAPDPSVDLWAEHSETGEQLWLCADCGE